jgi:hypothetical protein
MKNQARTVVADSEAELLTITRTGAPRSHQRTWAENDWFPLLFRQSRTKEPWWGFAHLSRPTYAGANVGHPSHPSNCPVCVTVPSGRCDWPGAPSFALLAKGGLHSRQTQDLSPAGRGHAE